MGGSHYIRNREKPYFKPFIGILPPLHWLRSRWENNRKISRKGPDGEVKPQMLKNSEPPSRKAPIPPHGLGSVEQ